MKYFVFFALVIAMSNTTYSQVDLDDGLVAYFPFNSNVMDESENGNNGHVFGATLTEDRFGNLLSAYHFNGNDYIEIPNDQSLMLNDFSLSVWIRIDDPDHSGLIIDKHLGNQFLDSYEIWYQDHRIWGALANNNGFGPYISFELPDISEWHHIVYTFDDDENIQRLYLDCELISVNTINISPANDSDPMLIGASYDQNSPQFFFEGDIDDIRIYSRPLALEEVGKLCQLEVTSVDNLISESDFNIFPNPVRNGAINFKSKEIISSYTISDAQGRFLEYNSLIENENQIQLNQQYQSGIYILKLTTITGLVIIKKVVFI